jgi:hypothetical protein
MSKMDSVACMICGYGGHMISRCPELVAPLRDGFYRGGGGGGGHSHDEDDQGEEDKEDKEDQGEEGTT